MIDRMEFTNQNDRMAELDKIAKEHLELRIEWAKALGAAFKTPYEDMLASSTDIYARMFGQLASEERIKADPRWQEFLQRLRGGENPATVALEFRNRYSDQGLSQVEDREYFGPFFYTYFPDEKIIDLHFGTMGWGADSTGALEQLTNAKQHFTDMFRAIKASGLNPEKVEGNSWLYGRLLASESMKRRLYEIFPKSFVDSHTQKNVAMRGGGRWGQFIGADGRMNKRAANEFRKRMHDPHIMTRQNYLLAFPISPETLEAPIQDFYTFYGIE